jgi:heme oxygenase (biliverdin-producing, ferredoxin)
MNNLKELTREQHRNAERSLFVKALLKKEVTPHQYYVYLSNQFMMYAVLEDIAEEMGVLRGIEDIRRSKNMSQDLQELEKQYGFSQPELLSSAFDYMVYIKSIQDSSSKLMAHVYVRHMGDLSGGQIIKRYVPGSGRHYEFDTDTDELKERVRERLNDDMAEEAKMCFSMISNFMKELEVHLGMGKTDTSS